MAIIKQDWTETEETLTITGLDSLAISGASVLIEVDNSTNKHLADDYDVDITPTAAATGSIDIYRAGSNVTGNHPATGDVLTIWTFVKSLDMASTDHKIDFRLEQLKKFNTLLFVNNSTQVTSAYTVKRQGADLTNA